MYLLYYWCFFLFGCGKKSSSLPDQSESVSPGEKSLSAVASPPNDMVYRDGLAVRMKNAIEQSKSYVIVLTDVLGEEGWDEDPLYPSTEVNCMIWLQWVLALAYQHPSVSREKVMDAIRYYESGISFGSRKHYIDRWVNIEPGPLVPYSGEVCPHTEEMEITLRLDLLQQHWKYPCSMYRPSENRFQVNFVSGSDFSRCSSQLSNGYYVVFPVAKSKYIDTYSVAGPMGLVHSMILHRNNEETELYHASLDYGKVHNESPKAFWERMTHMIKGFVIYELDPDWLPQTKSSSAEIQQIQICEQALLAPQ